jgi:imidazolonepropionase-like amidohydrolase/SAM-dependent methyltransferase
MFREALMILRNVEILGRPGVCDVDIEGHTIRGINSDALTAGPSIDFEGALAFPGLINSHDHLEFDCYEQLDGGPYRDYLEWGSAIHRRHAATIAAVEAVPRALRVRAGIAKNLLCGVTSVAHHGQAVESAGQPIHVIGGTRAIHSPRLGRLRPMLLPDRRAVVAHIGEGVDAETEREIDTFIRWNVWRKRLIGVHAIKMRDDQAERFAAVVWCPVSNDFLFGHTAPIARLKERTTVLFGTDSTLTASWSIWDHLRRARQSGALTDDELIASVTTKAARLWNLPNRGRIAPGAVADIVIARKRRDDQRDAFFEIKPEDILLVVSRGTVVLLDPSLGALPGIKARLFPVDVNGVEKLAAEDYSRLAKRLRSFLPSLPVPINGTAKPIMTKPIFRCPQCACPLTLPAPCACGFVVNEANGILDLMTARESAAVQPFVAAYEQIRAAEQWGGDDLELPFHPRRHLEVWEIRRRTFEAFRSAVVNLERGVALDIGAGNCWLARYLNLWGFDAIALDINTGEGDGLRAGQKFIDTGGEFVRVRAGMERLPFTSGQIRLLTAGASFHYVSDFRATLSEFERVLSPGGVIAILDSPFYENGTDGERGIATRVAEFRRKYGIPDELARRARYFTFDDFKGAAQDLKLRIRIQPIWPGWRRKREEIHARIRGREIARFPLVLLEKQASNV